MAFCQKYTLILHAMKRILGIFIAIMSFHLHALASDTIVVVNAETLVPIKDVSVYIDHKQGIGTNYEGKFLLFHKDFKELHLAHPNYLTRVLYPEDIKGDTISLLPNHRTMLSEVIIYGNAPEQHKLDLLSKTDAELIQMSGQGGLNLLELATQLYKKLFPMKDRDRRQKKYISTIKKY